MMIQINSGKVIDLIVAHLDDLGSYTSKKLKGKPADEVNWARQHEAEASHIYETLADTLGCSNYDIIAAAHIASRWYNKTRWMISMPESMADALISGAVAGLLRETKPKEPGYYSDWAARRAARKRSA